MRLCLQFVNMDQMIVNYLFPCERGFKDSISSTLTHLHWFQRNHPTATSNPTDVSNNPPFQTSQKFCLFTCEMGGRKDNLLKWKSSLYLFICFTATITLESKGITSKSENCNCINPRTSQDYQIFQLPPPEACKAVNLIHHYCWTAENWRLLNSQCETSLFPWGVNCLHVCSVIHWTTPAVQDNLL